MNQKQNRLPDVIYSAVSIVFALAIGYGIREVIPILPASLYGLIVFCLLLKHRVIDANKLANSIQWILKHMGVCFVPAGVGIIEHYSLIQQYGITLVLLTFVTTMALLTVIGLFVQHDENRQLKR